MARMRILFLSAQIPGHLDWGGYLPTAAELARRGHDVLWASGEDVRAAVEKAGVAFHALEATGWRWPPPSPLTVEEAAAAPDAESLQRLKQVRALDQWLNVERVSAAAAEVIAVGREFAPDVVVTEMFVAAAGLAAEALGKPFVVAGWPAPPPVEPRADAMTELARGRLDELLARFGLRGRYWTEQGPPALLSPSLHLTYWSERWFGGVAMRSQTRHAGGQRPAHPPPPPDDLPSPDGAPWVLITLGTSFNRDPNFFVASAQAAVQMSCVPLIALGADSGAAWVQAMLPSLPPTAVVRSRLDFAATLPYTAAAIHHGGAGTTHALVVHATPQIVVPHAADQHRQARAVAHTGVGFHMPPRRTTVDNLVNCLAALLPDLSVYRGHARRLQEEFHALGGIPAAAAMLEEAGQPSGAGFRSSLE